MKPVSSGSEVFRLRPAVNRKQMTRTIMLPVAYLLGTGLLLVWFFWEHTLGSLPQGGIAPGVTFLQNLLTALIAMMYVAYTRIHRHPWGFAFCLAFCASFGAELAAKIPPAFSSLHLHLLVFSISLIPGLLFPAAGTLTLARLLGWSGGAVAAGACAVSLMVLAGVNLESTLYSRPIMFAYLAMGTAIQIWAALSLIRIARTNATVLLVSSLGYMLFITLYAFAITIIPAGSLMIEGSRCVRAVGLLLLPAALLSDFFQTTRQRRGQSHVDMDAALKDALTNLPNRRALDMIGPKLFKQSLTAQKPVSVLVLDIDHFKQVNDLHGHHAGDVVLSHFGKLIHEQVRSTDFVARYGGEEFVAVLPGAPLAPAIRLAERMRQAVEDSEVQVGTTHLKITTSIGAATAFPGDKLDFKATFERADKNLYRAKRSGRNQVMAEPLPGVEF